MSIKAMRLEGGLWNNYGNISLYFKHFEVLGRLYFQLQRISNFKTAVGLLYLLLLSSLQFEDKNTSFKLKMLANLKLTFQMS